jgi:hypothetical protein
MMCSRGGSLEASEDRPPHRRALSGQMAEAHVKASAEGPGRSEECNRALSRTTRRLRLWVGGTLAAGAALRLFRPTRHSLWSDEGASLGMAEGSLTEVFRRLLETKSSEHFQPLYFLLLQMWLGITQSDLGLKTLSIGLSILALVAFHRCALRLFGARAGCVATMLFSFNAFQVYYAQEVRPYALVSLLTVLQLWLYSMMTPREHSPRFFSWQSLSFSILNGLAVFASIFQGLLVFSLSLSDFALMEGSPSPMRRIRRWLARWSGSVAACSPAVAFFLLSSSGAEAAVPRALAHPLEGLAYSAFGLLFGSTLGPPQTELRSDERLGVLLGYWPSLTLASLVGGLLVAVVVRSLWIKIRGTHVSHCTRSGWVLTLATAAGFGSLVVFALATGIQWLPRHSSFLSPLLALVAGFHLSELTTSRRRHRGVVGLAVATGLVTLNVLSLQRYFFDKRYLKDDYRSVGRMMAASPEVRALMVWGNVPLVRRYGGLQTWGYDDLPPERTLDELDVNLSPGEHVFLLVNRPYYWSERPIESIVPGYKVIERAHLPGFQVFRLRKPDSRGEEFDAIRPR